MHSPKLSVAIYLTLSLGCADEPARIAILRGASSAEDLSLDNQFTVIEESIFENETPAAPSELPSLLSIPPDGLERLLGQSAGVEERIYTLNGQTRTERRVFLVDASHQVSTEERQYIASERALRYPASPNASQVEPSRDLIRDSADRLYYYVQFFPEVPPDAPVRVDWTVLENRQHPRTALLEAEQLRQLELVTLTEHSRTVVEEATSCEWVNRAGAEHAGYVWCDSADELLAIESVKAATPLQQAETQLRGDDFRSATGMQNGHAIGLGYTGTTPRPSSSRSDVEVAVLDPDGFNVPQLHPAYNFSGGSSRITRRRTCSGGACTTTATTSTPSTSAAGVHGELILGAYANILNGQDSSITVTADREDRSYGAHGAQLELYYIQDGASFAEAITDAVSNDGGVDIVQISTLSGTCGSPASAPNMAAAWDLATSLGAVGVISAGNFIQKYNDNCWTNGWATRPEILVIGGHGDWVDNTSASSQWINASWPASPRSGWVYDTEGLMGWHWSDSAMLNNCPNAPPDPVNPNRCWSSTLGGADLRVNGTMQTRAWTLIDVVALATRELSPLTTGSSGSYVHSYGDIGAGTSNSSPEAAAVLASIFDWAYASSISVFNTPGIVNVNTHLMGDGARGGHRAGAGPSTSYNGKDRLWGAGRLKMRIFNSIGLDDPMGWGTGWFSISNGQAVDIGIAGPSPVDNDVDFWRGAVSWVEPNINPASGASAADIVIEVVVTNPTGGTCVNPGGTGGTTIEDDYSFDLEKLITVQGTTMSSVRGKCAWLRIRALSVPTGSTQLFHADFFEDRDRESGENLNGID